MTKFLTEFEYSSFHVSILFIDNKSEIEVSKNPEHHRHMKHLDLWHYWLKNVVQESLITPAYVSSYQNVADLFIKPVQSQVIKFSVPKLGLTP